MDESGSRNEDPVCFPKQTLSPTERRYIDAPANFRDIYSGTSLDSTTNSASIIETAGGCGRRQSTRWEQMKLVNYELPARV